MTVPRETTLRMDKHCLQALMAAVGSPVDPKIRREEGLPRPIQPLSPIDGAQVWDFHAVEGVPFEQMLPQLAKNGMEPCWSAFFMRAMAQKGRSHVPTIAARVMTVVQGAYWEHPQVLGQVKAVAERIGGKW